LETPKKKKEALARVNKIREETKVFPRPPWFEFKRGSDHRQHQNDENHRQGLKTYFWANKKIQQGLQGTFQGKRGGPLGKEKGRYGLH